MGAVNHQARAQVGFAKLIASGLDVLGSVVWSRVATAEDDVAGVVAAGVDNGGDALLCDREEVVVHGGGADGVDGNVDVAVGAVFEAHGDRKTRGELTVDLRFRGAGTDGAPRDEITNVLRGNRVEEFDGRGDARLVEVNEEATGRTQALVDREAEKKNNRRLLIKANSWTIRKRFFGASDVPPIHQRVVDETFPTDCCSGLFKVDPHDDTQVFLGFVHVSLEFDRVFLCGVDVVDRARTDNDDQAVVFALDDGFGVVAGFGDGFAGEVRERKIFHENF